MMDVFNTIDWPAEKLLPYGREITRAMRKLVERFPREVTLQHLAQEILNGSRQLWLIMDGDKFISFVLTEIKVNQATGLKTLLIPSFAGEEGAGTVHLIGKLEAWGRENGCDESVIYGRDGWRRPLSAQGYHKDMAIFRKAL